MDEGQRAAPGRELLPARPQGQVKVWSRLVWSGLKSQPRLSIVTCCAASLASIPPLATNTAHTILCPLHSSPGPRLSLPFLLLLCLLLASLTVVQSTVGARLARIAVTSIPLAQPLPFPHLTPPTPRHIPSSQHNKPPRYKRPIRSADLPGPPAYPNNNAVALAVQRYTSSSPLSVLTTSAPCMSRRVTGFLHPLSDYEAPTSLN